MDISLLDISNFLPHTKPMLFVDKILEIDETTVTTQFQIISDCIFLENKCLSEAGLIENAAQTASTIIGQRFFKSDDLTGDQNSVVGYISAIKKVEIFFFPKLNQTLITKAKLLSRFDTGLVTLCSLKTETFCDKKLIVSSTLHFLIHEV